MKKFAKICLITILALIIAGAILLGSGLVLGGNAAASDAFAAVQKHSHHLWGINFSSKDDDDWDENDVIDPDDDWDDDDENDWHDDDDADDHDDDDDDHWSEALTTTMEDGKQYDFTYNQLSSLEIDVNAAELNIESSADADKISFIAQYKSTSDTILLMENGKGSIQLSSQDHHIVGDPTARITVLIPEDYFIGNLELELAAGNVKSTAKLNADEVDISVNAGNLTIKNITATEMDIETDAGNTELTLPGSTTDYNYDLSCSLGRIEFNGQSKNGVEKNYTKNNHADRDISIECSAGNISVFFQ